MPLPISIIIPTCERGHLLARTLTFLADCERPAGLTRVVVIENGPRGNAQSVVREFADRLPIRHEHVPSANKSRALNHILRTSGDELMIFFDDDVRILPQTLAVYAAAVGDRVSGFWGGRCSADYEEEPVDWLKRYLPPSAIGWSLGDAACAIHQPHALGFNWAAFSRELKTAGGFDENRGPGTFARGQESEMQERLLRAGIEGRYLPDAVVYHFVPKSRCSEAWALQRSRQTAHACGVTVSRKILPKRLRHDVLSACKAEAYDTVLKCFDPALSAAQRFHCRYWREWFIGIREGIHHARPFALSPATPTPALLP